MNSGKGEALPASRPVARVVDVAEAYLANVTERDARSDQQLAADLIQLRHAIDLLELEFSRDAATFAAGDEYELQGSTTPIDWIRHNCKMSGHAAAERVCTGEKLESLANSVEAAFEGRIGYAHLALMARTAEWIEERAGTFPEHDLLAVAEDCSVSRFRHTCHHARHAANPDDYATDEERIVDERSMTLTLCGDGGYALGGKLDAAGGAALRTALEPLARRQGADDDRCKERRLADALVELAHHAPAHHLKHWIHGGDTDLDNLGSLCHRHHRMCHEGGWQIIRDKDGRILTIPPLLPTTRWSSPDHARMVRDLQAISRPEGTVTDRRSDPQAS